MEPLESDLTFLHCDAVCRKRHTGQWDIFHMETGEYRGRCYPHSDNEWRARTSGGKKSDSGQFSDLECAAEWVMDNSQEKGND